ncbi:Eco57I restriction-modification methylase domain-containing protein [Spirosoma jeollabukense]
MKPLKAKRPATSQQGAPVQLSLFDVLLQVAPELVPAVRAVNQIVSPRIQRFSLQQEPAPTGEIGRIRANLAAIALCKSLNANQQQPTPEQCNELARFSGWGSLAALWDEVTHRATDVEAQTEEQNRWYRKYKSLRMEADSLMTPMEREGAGQSTLNAFFTSIEVIKRMWALAEKVGFKGGRVLEPAAGTGHFIGAMPDHLRQASTITAVEKDPLSAAILALLYPEVITHATGLEVAPLERGKYDLIIGNVPFGDYTVFDAVDRDWCPFHIHNYFIGKASRLVVPGGLVCFITSMGTLDAGSKAFRLKLDEQRMELLGAIRLPSCAFDKTASTEVTTDILLFQKRPENQARTSFAQPFVNTATLRTLTSEGEDQDDPPVMPSIQVNQYYVENPHRMLGEMTFASEVGKGGLYRGDRQTLFLERSSELATRLDEAVTQLGNQLQGAASRFGQAGAKLPEERTERINPALSGTVKIRGRMWSKQSIYRSYSTLKRLFFALLKAEQNQSDSVCDALRQELQDHYTFFVTTYGRLSANRSLNWIESVDGQFLSVQALEIQKLDAHGKTVIVESAILRERVFGALTTITHVDLVEDGLSLSLFNHGRIDLDYISTLTGKPIGEVRTYLLTNALAFIDPERADELLDAGTYLSGDIREKLTLLEGRLLDEPQLQANLDALQAILPPSLPVSLISFQLGSNWLPLACITDWIQTLLSIKLTLVYSSQRAEYRLANQTGYSALNQSQGTKERTALELIEAALNQRSIVITKTIQDEAGNKKEVKDIEAMTAAVQQQEVLQEQFNQWAREHYAPAIEKAFNERFNSYVERQFAKPTMAHYPGASPLITLRDHQFKAVERGKQEDCLFAHWVGTGKTWEIISTAMELIRLGRASKALVAVQNSTVEDFAKAWRALYPGAIVYQPTPADLQASNRKRFLQRIATNRFDGIVIPQSFLKLIPDDVAIEEELIRDELSRIDYDDRDPSAEGRANRRSGKQRVKQINKRKAKIEAKRLEQASRKKDQMLNFSQLGIDALFLDEAHKYKRFGFTTSRYQIKGIDTAGSQDAFQAMVKCRTILNKNGRVILATGTPISNTMAEAWTMLRYIASDRLEKLQLATFDQFCGTFCKVVPVFELSTSGQFKTVERLAQFMNVAQLSALYRQSVDVVLADDVHEFKTGDFLPVLASQPATETTPANPGFTRILLPQTPGVRAELYAIRQTLRWFEQLTGKEKRENSHIPLVMYGKAKKATLDIRLIDPTAEDEPGNKVNRAVAEIHRIYHQTGDVKGTQLVFCDVFTSSASMFAGETDEETGRSADAVATPGRSAGLVAMSAQFNLFDEIAHKLRLLGIPTEEICVVPADKNKREPIFANVRTGRIRVLMGSSERLGVGVNVQERLAAIHHLDAPNRPTDFEQRNGRIIRQGNLFAVWKRCVEVLTYGVEKTLDATSYGRLAMKQKFINQVLKGGATVETMADVSDDDDFSSMNYEQMMATLSGSQTALLYTAKNHELTRLNQQKKAWQRGLMNAQSMIEEARRTSVHLNGLLPKLSLEAEIIKNKFVDVPTDEVDGMIKTIGFTGQQFTSKADWSEPLERYFSEIKSAARRTNGAYSSGLLTVNGLDIHLKGEWSGHDRETGRAIYSISYQWGVNLKGQINYGWALGTSLRAAINRTLDAPEVGKKQLERAISQQEAFSQNLNQPFKKQEQLTQLSLLVSELKKQLETEVIEAV